MTPAEAVLERTAPANGLASRTHVSSYRVLVADDERSIVESLKILLHAEGFSVVTATSPAEALSAAQTYPFHAAIVDLNYGHGKTTGEQGLDLVSALGKADPALPVVAMTGWSSIDLALEAMRRGAKDFVEKPWDESRLVAILRSQAELGMALRRVAELESEVQKLRKNGGAGATTASMADMRLLDVEGALVKQAMEKFQGNISRTARALGLSRSALYRRLERHKLG
jgi:DNA-binding NtrC family response regulator